MQSFSQFYRLISKIVFFSTQKLQVRFPTGGAATGSLPGLPERLKNVPDHLEGERVWHMAICDIFDERRAAPPAYGRRAWSKVVSYLSVFRYVFRFWSEFRRHLENKAKLQKARQNCVGVVENSFFGFKALQRVDVVRCSKNVFWIDCFRWPKGHLKQSKMHVEMKMQ